MKKLLVSIAAFAAMTASASAAVTTYECKFRRSNDGWVSEKTYVSVDTSARKAAVLDGFAYLYNDKTPVGAKFKQTSNGKYRITWVVKNVTGGSQNTSVRLTSTMRLDPRALDAYVTVNLSGPYVNTPRANGKCQVVKGRSLLG